MYQNLTILNVFLQQDSKLIQDLLYGFKLNLIREFSILQENCEKIYMSCEMDLFHMLGRKIDAPWINFRFSNLLIIFLGNCYVEWTFLASLISSSFLDFCSGGGQHNFSNCWILNIFYFSKLNDFRNLWNFQN